MRQKSTRVDVSHNTELLDELRRAFKDQRIGCFSISDSWPRKIVATITGSIEEQSDKIDEIYKTLEILEAKEN